MNGRSRRALGPVALAVGAVLLAGPLAGCAPDPAPIASVDQPAPLTQAQAEDLAALRFRNFAAGIVPFDGSLLGESGDLRVTGWIDFAATRGYARVAGAEATFLVVWDAAEVRYLDAADAAAPPIPAPGDGWGGAAFDPTTSELARYLAALVMLGADRPENPLLLQQGGARYLGEEVLDGVILQRYSGPGGAAGAEADLRIQYWLDADGMLRRFGIRLNDGGLSTAVFDPGGSAPDALPSPADLEVVVDDG